MGLFNFKKKHEDDTQWDAMLYPAGVNVSYIIKKYILDDRHKHGKIIIGDDVYLFQYGNLTDIIRSEVLDQIVSDVSMAAKDDGEIWYKINI